MTDATRARGLLVSGVYLAGAVSAVALVVVVIALLPQVQTLGYHVFVETPSLLWWGLVGGAASAAAYRTNGLPRRRDVSIAVVGVTVLFAVVIGPGVGDAYAAEDLAEQTTREAAALRSLPDTSRTHARTRPESAAATAATAAVETPGFGTREGRLTYRNGSYAWSYPVVPDELLSRLTERQRGAVYVAADGSGGPVVRETAFRNGMGQFWLDAYEYQTLLARPTLDRRPATRTVFERDGAAYIAESAVRHEWRFRLFPLPQPYAVPKFAGVQLMDQDGSTEFVPADAVAADDRLAGQAVYPPSLVRRRIAALAYRDGAVAAALGGDGEDPQLGGFPGDGQWPVAAPTGNASAPSLTYFAPTSTDGEGVSRMWAVDARTGSAGVVQFRTPRIGADRAAKLVAQTSRVGGFGARTTGDPVPVTVEGSLHWQIAASGSGTGSGSASGISDGSAAGAQTGFVDAETGRTTVANASVAAEIATNASLAADDRRRDATASSAADRPTAAAGSVTVEIVVRNATGAVVDRRNVTVPAGGRVGVSVPNARNTTATPDTTGAVRPSGGQWSVDTGDIQSTRGRRPPDAVSVSGVGVSVASSPVAVPPSVPSPSVSVPSPSSAGSAISPSATSPALSSENAPNGPTRSV